MLPTFTTPPGGDGFELAPLLGAAGAGTSAMTVVSGFLDEAVEGRLRAVPEVLDTLPKPFEFNDLEERIQGCLESGAAIAGAAEGEGGAADPAPAEVPAQAADGEPGPTAPEPGTDDDDGWVEIAPR